MRVAGTSLGGADSSPLLLVGPSLGTAAGTLWGAAATRLADRFRVVGWDLPGHGGSGPASGFDVPALAAAVLALADELGAPTFAYAGDSLGGAVGLQLLRDAPARVTAATLLCTGARIGDPQAWLERAATVRGRGTAALVDSAPRRWFGPGFTERERATAQALLENLTAADDESYAAACEALAGFDVRDRLAEIAPPVVAVAGALDIVAPASALQQIAKGVQCGELVVLAGVGHLAPAEAPEEVARIVAAAGTAAEPRTTAQVRAAGMHTRRAVLGDAHVDRALGGTTGFTAEFQDFITEYAWGGIWTRPGLDRRSRSLVTLTALVARGHHEEFALHVRAAMRNGVTVEELKELLLQAAVYCGVPAANTAFRIAQRVLDEDADS